jgi:hypothetical protein
VFLTPQWSTKLLPPTPGFLPPAPTPLTSTPSPLLPPRHRNTLQQAGDSDQRVIQQLQDNRPAFEALTVEAAAGSMPRLQAPLVPLGEDPATVVARLRRNMDALNTLSGERAGEAEGRGVVGDSCSGAMQSACPAGEGVPAPPAVGPVRMQQGNAHLWVLHQRCCNCLPCFLRPQLRPPYPLALLLPLPPITPSLAPITPSHHPLPAHHPPPQAWRRR